MPLRLFLVLLATTQALFGQILPGRYTTHERHDNALEIHTTTCDLRLTYYTPDVVRVDLLSPYAEPEEPSPAVLQTPQPSLFLTSQRSDSALSFSSTDLAVHCTLNPVRLSFVDRSGRTLLTEGADSGMAVVDGHPRLSFLLDPGVHFYGTGERGTDLDKRGQAFACYNTQTGGYSTPLATMNINVPLLCTSNGYALFVDNAWKGRFDLGVADSTRFSYAMTGGPLTWFVIRGTTIPEQLERYTWLTGRQPLPPRWALGFIQSKNRYRDEAEARGIVRTLHEKGIPCDAIVLDLAWFRSMGDVAWDSTKWPHHDQMVSDFLAAGINTVLITEPYVVQPSANFREADSLGYFAKEPSGRTYLLEHWWSCHGCDAALVDMTNPVARAWWWSKHLAAFGREVAGIWTDLGEPERHPLGMLHFAGPTEKVHNSYNLLWAKTLSEGFARIRPDQRMLNLTRAGSAGIQRYGVVTWSGDVARSFGGLQVQIPMMLSMGMSGLAYHHSDMGGYARMPTTAELYVRWTELSVFSPVTRAHGAGESVGGAPTEPWQFGPRAEDLCRDLLRLRYRLLPYTYTLASINARTGMPIARPLLFLDPADPRLANESRSYMWGEAILVSPVVTPGESTKALYLPRGWWYNFWTDEPLRGGAEVRVDAPLGRPPLFVKDGSIIPMAPHMEHTGQRPLDTLTLLLYTGAGTSSSFTLYEDDGITLEYERGASASTIFAQQWSPAKRTLRVSIGAVRGSYTGKPARRTYRVEVHGITGSPVAVRVNGTPLHSTSGSSPQPSWFPIAGGGPVIFVQVGADSTSDMEIQY